MIQLSMLTLYVLDGCPFCAIVLNFAKENKIDLEIKNISEGNIEKELLDVGGKRQTPFLVDKNKDVKMYETTDIVKYLQTNYL